MSVPIVIASMMRPVGDTGVQTHVNTVREWLGVNGHAPVLVTPFDQPRWQIYPLFGVRALIDRVNKTASVWWYRHWHAAMLQAALRRRLADGRPCVVYAQCPLSAHAALRARQGPLQHVVMVVHFNLSQADEWADKGAIRPGGAMFRAIRRDEAAVLPQVDALVYVSEFMRRELQRRIPALVPVPSQVIPNFLRNPGEIVVGRPLADLITVGTLENRKNQRYALDILHAAKQSGHILRLTVAGDGPDRAKLEQHAQTLGISAQVEFLGFVRNAAALMPRHRACLHVARMENLPLTLIEALAHGVPVFAPAVGGMPEVFSDGREGRFIPLDDAPGAARLVVSWLGAAVPLQAARAAARQRYLEAFEPTAVARRLLDFLQRRPGAATT